MLLSEKKKIWKLCLLILNIQIINFQISQVSLPSHSPLSISRLMLSIMIQQSKLIKIKHTTVTAYYTFIAGIKQSQIIKSSLINMRQLLCKSLHSLTCLKRQFDPKALVIFSDLVRLNGM